MNADAVALHSLDARAREQGLSRGRRLPLSASTVRIVLGCIWLLDGLLQFQSYMYTHAFVVQVLDVNAQGEPSFIGWPILTLARLYGSDASLWNTLAGLTQCAIGLGMIVSARTVRIALLASFAWAAVVWWFGEGFGLLFSGAPVSPLMGAPGAVLLYALVGLLVWPTSRRAVRSVADGGPTGDRAGRAIWSAVWLEAAVLWLLNVNRSSGAIRAQLLGMAAGAPHLIARWQIALAAATRGHGEVVAVALALASIMIAGGVWIGRLRVSALAVGSLLSLAYWVLGQNLGGPFWIGNATDVNAGPILVLLALALMPAIVPTVQRSRARERGAPREPRRSRSWRPMVVAAAVALVALTGGLIVATHLHVASAGDGASSAMIGMDMTGRGSSELTGSKPCTDSGCSIPEPRPNELSVAGELGPALAAVWLTPTATGLNARLELLTPTMSPVHVPVTIAAAASRQACGPGCWTFTLPSGLRTLALSAREQGREYNLRLPIGWERGHGAGARRLLDRAVATMRSLAGVRVRETLTSGPPSPVETIRYRFSAPDRMSYYVNANARVVAIGASEWSFAPGQGWQRSAFGSGSFSTRDWYDWLAYDRSIQLLDEHGGGTRRVADVALMSKALPVWFELRIAVASGRVLRVGMVAGGHFMVDHYSDYGVPQKIVPPTAG